MLLNTLPCSGSIVVPNPSAWAAAGVPRAAVFSSRHPTPDRPLGVGTVLASARRGRGWWKLSGAPRALTSLPPPPRPAEAAEPKDNALKGHLPEGASLRMKQWCFRLFSVVGAVLGLAE